MSRDGYVKKKHLFENPFQIEDLMVFDDDTLWYLLDSHAFGLTLELLALSLQGASEEQIRRFLRLLSPEQRQRFLRILWQPIVPDKVQAARQQVLDNLFWELTYWKTPELYEELTEGELLHPGIFQRLAPDLRDSVVLDVGAGTGRASFECLRQGAEVVYAVEPSPGLLRILERKRQQDPDAGRMVVCSGRFDHLPLKDRSIDLALSCSAFTSHPEQGGEPGLKELLRVTKSGGKVVLIWPRPEDREWLASCGFNYLSLPASQEMRIHFRSLQSALRCAQRFYAQNKTVASYIRHRQQSDVPFSLIGLNPPCDYCWLEVP